MSEISIPIATGRFLRLVDFLREADRGYDPIDVIEMAIDYWIDNASWKIDDLLPEMDISPAPTPPPNRGYVWKKILIPPGTDIRMTYRSETHHAKIVGDEFVFDGKKISPNIFVRMIGQGTTRNAWRDLYIKRPSDRAFRIADELRREYLAQQRRASNADGPAQASRETDER